MSRNARSAVAAAALLGAFAWPASADAAPANDNFASATAIGSLPFTDTVSNMQTATLEASDDPTLYCRTNGQGANTVWYRYTTGAGTSSTSPEYLRVSTAGSTYDTDIEIFAGQRQVPDMAFGGCADLPSGQEQAVARLDQPSTAYYIEIAASSSLGGTPSLALAVDHPPSYTVTGTTDGLGSCSGSPAATCSTLRAAVTASHSDPGAILLPGAGPYTVNLGTPEGPTAAESDNSVGDLDFTKSMLIDGTGSSPAVLTGGPDRLLQMTANGVSLALRNLELANGSSAGDGGALDAHAGFADLDGVTVRDSSAAGGGGGIAENFAGLRVQRSTIRDNTATGSAGGGGVLAAVGGLNLSFIRSTISGNHAAGTSHNGGGFVQNGPSTTVIADSTVSGNTATGKGGGAYALAGGFNLIHATLGNNTAGVSGGGLRIDSGGANSYASAYGANSAPTDPDCSDGNNAYMGGSNVRATLGSCAQGVFNPDTIADPLLRPLGFYGGPTKTQPVSAPGPAIDVEDLQSNNNRCFSEDSQGPAAAARLDTDQRGLPRALDGDGSGATPPCDAGATENQPPACTGDASLTTSEDTPSQISLPCSDVDGEAVAGAFDTNPAHGALTPNGVTPTYTPAANFNGADGFTFHAVAGGVSSTPVRNAGIAVTPVDDPPTAGDDSATVPAGQVLTVGDPGVLGNDLDFDGPGLAAILVSNPSHGTLTLNSGGGYRYTPSSGFSGPDQFTYRATDGLAASAPAVVRIAVTPTAVARDVTPPTLSKLKVRSSRSRFTATFSSTEAGRFTALLTRAAPGIRRGRRCVAPPRRPARRARRCTRQLRVKSLGGRARNGSNGVALGRLGPNSYRLQITVTDAAGNRSKPLVGSFRVRAKKR